MLHLFCGKLGAGKTSAARRLAERERACLFVEDLLLERLYPGEVQSLADYVARAARIKSAIAPQVVWLLRHGTSVVLDFPGNTLQQRRWFHELIDASAAAHRLHFIDADDATCLRQMEQRNVELPPGSRYTTEAEFHAITAYFQPPTAIEGFELRRYASSADVA
jgi:predicted kinase